MTTTQQSLIEALNRLGYDVEIDGGSYRSRHYGRISETEARKIVTSHGHSIGAAL